MTRICAEGGGIGEMSNGSFVSHIGVRSIGRLSGAIAEIWL